MSTKKVLFKKEYAPELLHIAGGDLKSAQTLAKSEEPGRLENVLFLAQQSMEKAVKAVLVFKQISFPLVHDLGILVALLPEEFYPPNSFNLSELNAYASVRRYEEGSFSITKTEIDGCLLITKEVLDWAQKIISGKL